ncbi:Uncharacterized protein Adt_39365 [Abeliophyllum distichum]|uniref:Uncharacterized protein n=1 Tax=Abeliophyllum distichum TaxID=126358 RepID=A0ABD1Q4V7_9LAMI
MILHDNGEVVSEVESENDSDEMPELEDIGVEYPVEGEALVARRALNAQIKIPDMEQQRENIFHTRCYINNKSLCMLVIFCWVDRGSMIGGLYMIGFKNRYSFVKDGNPVTLVPLTPKQVYEDQLRLKGEADQKKKSELEVQEQKSGEEKNESVPKATSKSREKKKVSFFAKESEVRRAFKENQPVILLVYKESHLVLSDINQSLPNSANSLLQEFEDVFPDELPSTLPPIRGIEHQIDFVPGSVIPNRPTYRSNPEETKELQRQVEELMSKGYVRESMSPCAVPVLLVSQEGWNLENVY